MRGYAFMGVMHPYYSINVRKWQMAPQILPDVQSYLALSIPGRVALSANEDAQYKTTPGTGVIAARAQQYADDSRDSASSR